MIDKTAREAQAIRDARRLFAETLNDLGLMAPFFDRSAAEIDYKVRSLSGWRRSLAKMAGLIA